MEIILNFRGEAKEVIVCSKAEVKTCMARLSKKKNVSEGVRAWAKSKYYADLLEYLVDIKSNVCRLKIHALNGLIVLQKFNLDAGWLNEEDEECSLCREGKEELWGVKKKVVDAILLYCKEASARYTAFYGADLANFSTIQYELNQECLESFKKG